MSGVLPNPGSEVTIKDKIASKEECGGFNVHQKHLDCRRPSETGYYKNWVPGCGGDVWWITHMDNTVGAYMHDEVEVVQQEGVAHRISSRDTFEDISIEKMPLEDVREAISTLYKHLGLRLERRQEYTGYEYRVMPEEP